jgi:hypothetical protein
MKSRLYYGHRIPDTRGSNEIAVFIVESTEHDRWTEEKLVEYFTSHESRLSGLIETFASRIPDISSARKEGF